VAREGVNNFPRSLVYRAQAVLDACQNAFGARSNRVTLVAGSASIVPVVLSSMVPPPSSFLCIQ
jgi:hypothetical protein